VSFQLRPLPSTGITRLRRYYEPLRHPKLPGLSLASCQLIPTAITAGTSRVTLGPLLPTCRRQYPGRSNGICSLVRFHPLRPSHETGAGRLLHHCFRVLLSVYLGYGLHARRVAFATLYTRGFSSLVASTAAPIATGWSEPVPGRGTPAVDQAPFTAHPVTALIRVRRVK